MNRRGTAVSRGRHRPAACVRISIIGAFFFVLAALVLMVRSGIEASSEQTRQGHTAANPVSVFPKPETTPAGSIPAQTSAPRIRVVFGEKQELQVATGVDSVVLVSPEIASAAIKDRFTIILTGIKFGETMLLVSYGKHRFTYIVDVVHKPLRSELSHKFINDHGADGVSGTTGSFTTSYSHDSGGASILRQTIDYRHVLSKGKTLRISGDMFKLMGNADRSLAIAHVQDFAFNRLSVGLDTAKRSFDVLDSQVSLSPLTLNGYTMRGFHMVSKPRANPGGNLPSRGLEIFAGLARPSLAFFDQNGFIAGVMIPVITRPTFQARAGVIVISADRKSREARGGALIEADAAYAPSREISADAELSYANGDLSWRGRLELKYPRYGASAEITRFSRSSPLNSIGAQGGGRCAEMLSSYWRPSRQLSTSFGYNHTQVSRLTNAPLADFNRSTFFANANYAITKGSRINLRYSDQSIETALPGATSKFAMGMRTLLIGNSQRFSKSWSNMIDLRVNFNREATAGSGLERGFSLSEQLQFTNHGESLTGFFHYTHNSTSLASLILRNPQLLPPIFQAAFKLDPAEFLRLNRDRIAFLLGDIDLPRTRSFDAGIRFQRSFSRLTLSGETRYNAGEISAGGQKSLSTSASMSFRLDKANSMQVNRSQMFAQGGGQSAISISFRHLFGASGDGSRFSRLFNFTRGKIRGRVYYDLNGNGVADPAEPGAAGLKIQIDGIRSVITDKDGRYELSGNSGSHRIKLLSGALGVRLLASTPTEETIEFHGGNQPDLNFGVRDSGSISGRIFNDAVVNQGPPEASQGLSGVRVMLRSEDVGFGSIATEQITGANGSYDFQNLRPGKYSIEIDPASLPPNFEIPEITVGSVGVEPLHTSEYDVPARAQRAITGIVFIDKDGDGKFTPGNDESVEGASVTKGHQSSISGADGSYILRNLPAGKIQLTTVSSSGVQGQLVVVELGADPVTKRSVNILLNR